MTSKRALTELFNEANRFSFEETHYSTYDLWEMCKLIEKDLEILEIIKNSIITRDFEYGGAFDDCNKISFTVEIIQPKDFINKLNGVHYTTVKVDNGFEKLREWLLNEK